MKFEDYRNAVDQETTRIGGVFERLLAKQGQLTAEEQAEADASIATLKGIGADPEVPVPPPAS